MNLSLLDTKFILLLAALALLRRYCPSRLYPPFGLIASAILVSIASVKTFIVVTAITVLYLYPSHLLWHYVSKRQPGGRVARVVLGASIVGLVLLLIVFKVHRQFDVPFLGGSWAKDQLIAVVGFSYFVFRAINFLHIQSILDIEEHNPFHLLYFMLFPPTLTSGPIQKYQDFRQQLLAQRAVTASEMKEALYRVTRGYFRKVVLAYTLDQGVRKLLDVSVPNAYSSLLSVAMLYLFFYYDFAGYSDVAIGFGALMGIRVPENFRKPFVATSVTEFWRNWHITLVDWFRDNVYVPLGGMQSSRVRASGLAFLIMLLCGLWHGLTISFVMWGCWHGCLLFAEGMTSSKPLQPSLRHGPRYWARVVWTNARVALGALFFLPDLNSTLTVLKGLTRWV